MTRPFTGTRKADLERGGGLKFAGGFAAGGEVRTALAVTAAGLFVAGKGAVAMVVVGRSKAGRGNGKAMIAGTDTLFAERSGIGPEDAFGDAAPATRNPGNRSRWPT
jgi:hypothetical protein